MKKLILSILLTLAMASLAVAETQDRELTFEERVRAQEALERVYYSHQTGATRPFEQAISRDVYEHKVRRYLKQSVALERFWQTPITADGLLGNWNG